MPWIRTLLQISFLVPAYAASLTTRSERIAWGSCDEINGTLPIQCGNLTVPLDYTNPKPDATLDLQLLKVPAAKTPKKGSVLFNFGGPGLEARSVLASDAKKLQALTGGHYDLIAQDPRGTANTLKFSCFESQEAKLANFTYTRFSELAGASDKMPLGRLWSSAAMLGEYCYQYPDSKQKGELLSTAFTARDIMQIVDAVEDDGLLRYWGFSYGTVLGSTPAAMFPDRIDKIILDGAMNPHQYYHWYEVECVKSPDTCILARRNATAADLEKSVYNLLDDIKYQPIVHGGTLIEHGLIKTLIRESLNSPPLWPKLAGAFEYLLAGNATGFLETRKSLLPSGAVGELSEPLFGIPCSEKKTGKHSFNEVMPTIREVNDKSKLLGSSGNAVSMICSQWKFDAKERYEGDFRVKTKHPMLVIGNTYDPATPLRSAQNTSATFEGSLLLEHGGFGHTSQAHGSVCTGNAIRNYIMDGTLPEPGTVCEPAYPPFANKTWDDILPEIGKEGSK